MKIAICLLLALSFFYQSNAQSGFYKSHLTEIQNLIDDEKFDLARKNLRSLRTNDWNKLSCEEKAITYRYWGNLHYGLYEDDRALQYYIDSSYQKVIDCNAKFLENALLSNIGAIYLNQGNQFLASKYYNKLKLNYLSLKISPSPQSCQHLINLAIFYDDSGDLYNSFLCSWKAIQIGQHLDFNLADAYNLLGIYFDKTKQYDEAIANYSKALELLPKEERLLRVHISTNKALVFLFMKNYSKSLDIVNQLKNVEKSEEQMYALLNLEALIYSDQGNYTKSEGLFSQMDIIKWIDIEEMYHHGNLADIKLKMGDDSSAIKIYKKLIKNIENKWAHLNYIPIFSPEFLKTTELKCRLSKALYSDTKKGNRKARKEIFKLYSQIDDNFQQIVSSNWESKSSSYLLNKIYPNIYYIIMSHLDEYTETGNIKSVEKAYQILSEVKNQILERDIKSRIRLKETISDSILVEYHKLKSDLNFQYAEDEKSKQSQIQLIENFEKYQLKLDSILVQKGSNFTLKPKSLQEVKNSLSNQDAFLDIYFAEENLICFSITKEDIAVNSQGLTLDLLVDFMNSLKNGQPINERSNDAVFHALFDDLDLNKISTITIHADGLFHKLPFGAIKNPITNSFLIEDYSFQYLLSTDSIYTESYEWQADHCLGVASDYNLNLTNQEDSFSLNWGKLTGTTDELSTLIKYFNTDTLANRDASFDNLSRMISNQNYNIVQLSMHGKLDDRFLALSGLIFEKRDSIELIDLNRMTGLNLNTDLTIVNSCHSGAGKHITGEAISNLNTSLFISGSKANMVNLWTSSDKASSEVLNVFHKELSSGKSKSKALQLAKKEYLKSSSPSFRHPKYWSSLVLFGNDSPIHKTNFTSLYLILGLLFGLIAFFFLKKNQK